MRKMVWYGFIVNVICEFPIFSVPSSHKLIKIFSYATTDHAFQLWPMHRIRLALFQLPMAYGLFPSDIRQQIEPFDHYQTYLLYVLGELDEATQNCKLATRRGK